jgi:lysyl-tRNA synthetase class I
VADTPESDWVARSADEVIAAADHYRPGKPVVCASGLSPSGPVNLGNLREVLTPHLVADEIRPRGAFVPSGADRTSPGSSYVVGGRIVGDVFGGTQPIGPMYAFAGMAGMAKMSSSKGGVLLVGGETGPRLPTLLLAIGADRVRELLALPDK